MEEIIAEAIHLSFRSTSKHLGILIAVDILEKEQRNVQMFYRLVRTVPSAVRHILSLL